MLCSGCRAGNVYKGHGDAGQAALELQSRGLTADVVVVDPPRKGLSPDVIQALAQMSPRKIAYVSCDPATLARDVALLKEQGFRLQKAKAVDMFPRCAHVETVVLLSKGEIDSKKVRVEFSLEDMDMSGFQKGATYEQIKAYVLEHTGLKVSSLYISQIKRKCGLDVGQNYNLSKKEDAKVPKCPPEKEAAITEAKRQGYVFQADTPLFMLQNAELIKQSAEKDINTINFVPEGIWTNELASFVYQLALKNGYVLNLSNVSPSDFLNAMSLVPP